MTTILMGLKSRFLSMFTPLNEELAKAAEEGKTDIAKVILKSLPTDSARIEALKYRNCHHGTPLGIAAEKGHVELTKLFFDHLANWDINAGDQRSTIDHKGGDQTNLDYPASTALAITLEQCASAKEWKERGNHYGISYPCNQMLSLFEERGLLPTPASPQDLSLKPSVSSTFRPRFTPEELAYSTAAGRADIAEGILESFPNDQVRKKALLQHRTCHYGTPLGIAVEKGDADLTKLFFRHLTNEEIVKGNHRSLSDSALRDERGTVQEIALQRCAWSKQAEELGTPHQIKYPCKQMLSLLEKRGLFPQGTEPYPKF